MNPIIGARDLVTAELLTDTSSALTYEAVKTIEGLVDVSITDNSGDADPFYADDVEKGRISKQAKLGVTIEILATAVQTIADFFGHTVGSNGALVKKDGDVPPYRAIGFKAAAHGGGDDGIWLKKCVPTRRTNSMTYHTKEGETVTLQTIKIELEAIPTIKDKEYQHLVNSEDPGMETAWATWFETVPGATT